MLRDTDRLLNDIGAELLDRQRAHVASKLMDDAVGESVVIQVKDVLNDLPTRPLSVQHSKWSI